MGCPRYPHLSPQKFIKNANRATFDREAFEERAVIIEFDGEQSRIEAEQAAAGSLELISMPEHFERRPK